MFSVGWCESMALTAEDPIRRLFQGSGFGCLHFWLTFPHLKRAFLYAWSRRWGARMAPLLLSASCHPEPLTLGQIQKGYQRICRLDGGFIWDLG